MAVLTDGVGVQDFLVQENTTLHFFAGEKDCYTYIRFLAVEEVVTVLQTLEVVEVVTSANTA